MILNGTARTSCANRRHDQPRRNLPAQITATGNWSTMLPASLGEAASHPAGPQQPGLFDLPASCAFQQDLLSASAAMPNQ